MKITQMIRVLEKIKRLAGECDMYDVIMSDKKVQFIFIDKKGDCKMYTQDYRDKILPFGIERNNSMSREGIMWGDKTDAEMEEYNKTGHWD